MSHSLFTRNIILDTTFFVGKKFNFSHKEFESLKTLVEKKLITIYITEINKREIRKKIAEQVSSSYEKLAAKDIAFLSIVPEFKDFSAKYTISNIIQMYEMELEKFCSECNVEIIPADTINIMSVFEDYCLCNPPFNKKDNKKNEFPDAFALASMIAWAKTSKEKAYVLSNDGDWKMFVEAYNSSKRSNPTFECIYQLKFFTSKVYHAEKELKKLISFSELLVKHLEPVICEQLCQKVQNAGYACESFDMEADITNLNILHAKVIDKNVLSIDEEFAIYAVDFMVTGVFEFDVTSYEGAMWDSEDKVTRGVEYFTVLKKLSFEVSAEVELSFDFRNKDTALIEGISIPRDFIINYDDEDAEIITQEEWSVIQKSK